VHFRRGALVKSGEEQPRFLADTHLINVIGGQKRLARHKGRATPVQVPSLKDEKNLSRITIELVIRIDIKGLRNLLLNLETSTHLLFVTNLTSQPVVSVSNKGSKIRKHDVSMRVLGYLPKAEAL